MASITFTDPTVLNPALITSAAEVSTETSTTFALVDPTTGFSETATGVDFTYDADGVPTGGTITGLDLSLVIGQTIDHGVTYTDLNVPMAQYIAFSESTPTDTDANPLLSANDQATGSISSENINGGGGNDTIIALDGNDTVDGGAGDDDVNGNKGQDIVFGGAGNDTVRGGQDNDTVLGGDGDDGHVNGNIGDDSVSGGNGNDTVYGGQGNDTLHGDAGNDVLSGDLGNDILYGDAGADHFTIAKGGGFDWVADFHPEEGDRIQLAPGTAYTVTSVSGQVVIDLGGGDELGLAGVPAGSFQTGWIVSG